MGKIKMAGEMLLYNRETSQALCDDLEGWVGKSRERLNREGIYVYLWLICVLYDRNHQHIVKQFSSN